jgi:hypothetical protein
MLFNFWQLSDNVLDRVGVEYVVKLRGAGGEG